MPVVSGNIRFMEIFMERRRQATARLSKTAIFSTYSPYFFRSFRGKANIIYYTLSTRVTLYCRVTLNENSNNDMIDNYYRAMHVVLARYCYRKSSVRPSVRPSVRNVAVCAEHIGWTSSKLITRIICLGSSLLGAPKSVI